MAHRHGVAGRKLRPRIRGWVIAVQLVEPPAGAAAAKHVELPTRGGSHVEAARLRDVTFRLQFRPGTCRAISSDHLSYHKTGIVSQDTRMTSTTFSAH